MPPRLTLRSVASRSASLRLAAPRGPTCLFCSLATRQQRYTPRRARNSHQWPNGVTYTAKAGLATTNASTARLELQEALNELQQEAPNYVNLSRVQLALRSLQQEPGKESIRVAVLGIANGHPGRTAKEVLRLLLADPLKAEEEWEKELDKHDTAHPLIIRIGEVDALEKDSMKYSRNELIREIHVSSPGLNGHGLEVLVMETSPFKPGTPENALIEFEDSVLVPTVDIPTSNTGRVTPITTPVHKALVVADGMLGALAVGAMPLIVEKDEIAAAINLRHPVDDVHSCPFMHIDLDSGSEALALFREDVGNAMKFEALWYQSSVPDVRNWMMLGCLSNAEGRTKLPVRRLVTTILHNALAAIQDEEARRLASAIASQTKPLNEAALNSWLADWAESAHAELQEQLDLVFSGRRWRKLGWWKLFWRVDDVTMLSSDMVTQRFLPTSEQEMIYLSGRIAESSALAAPGQPPVYRQPGALVPANEAQNIVSKWPTHITFTRRYLLDETIPALQALAQKLVLQTASSSGLAAALGGLMYLSSFGAYESGAVTALGIVWGLGRMQKKWDAARDFWEGEVREEGRKTIRAAESSVAEALDQFKSSADQDNAALQDLRRARALVDKAEDALRRLE